ncbi:hypothetical protein [Saccharicrinis aurantiacus]|uniref:hypothetical protein n=1 Tax=Saccharicrinis aurantiacus TaxID=1849719 RepID=UPI002491E756|nr:hypothetical protein [Saccharicrinis aurantiacus]
MAYSRFTNITLTLLLSISTLTSCKRIDIKSVLSANQETLQTICNDFLRQGTITYINITSHYDKGTCDGVNYWSLCFQKWEKYNKQTEKRIYLNSLEEVLKYEKIDIGDYMALVNTLKKYHLKSISKVYNCSSCVDLEFDLEGLRYSQDSTYRLKKDFEYLQVEQINTNWAYYQRDWN